MKLSQNLSQKNRFSAIQSSKKILGKLNDFRIKNSDFYLNDYYAPGHNLKLGKPSLLDEYLDFIQNNQNSDFICIIGSGSGLVPRFLNRNLPRVARIFLIDACKPAAGYGGPFDVGGWAYLNSKFYRYSAEVVIVPQSSDHGFQLMRNYSFEATFIDGDHSATQVYRDAMNFGSISKKLIFHDTNRPDTRHGVHEYLKRIKQSELVKISERGAGAMFVKTKL